jgi:hypothetical protein
VENAAVASNWYIHQIKSGSNLSCSCAHSQKL